jgi:hypothetical protein
VASLVVEINRSVRCANGPEGPGRDLPVVFPVTLERIRPALTVSPLTH